MRKKIIIAVVIVIILNLPILFCASIVITNNSIADNIEESLVSCELPQGTELVDSLSVAEKLTGNGNGMQYMGAILITSDLSIEQLKEYYSKKFDDVKIENQDSSKIKSINKDVRFENFSKTDGKTYYSVISFDDNRKETYSGFVCELLDLDLRGH